MWAGSLCYRYNCYSESASAGAFKIAPHNLQSLWWQKTSVLCSSGQTDAWVQSLPAVPSASACSSLGLCLNFISPKCSTAAVPLYKLTFSWSSKPSMMNESWTQSTNAAVTCKPIRTARTYADAVDPAAKFLQLPPSRSSKNSVKNSEIRIFIRISAKI